MSNLVKKTLQMMQDEGKKLIKLAQKTSNYYVEEVKIHYMDHVPNENGEVALKKRIPPPDDRLENLTSEVKRRMIETFTKEYDSEDLATHKYSHKT